MAQRLIKVLIVDDDEFMQENLADILEHVGRRDFEVRFDVRCVRTPDAATTEVLEKGFTPDVVLMDNDFTGAGLSAQTGINQGIPLRQIWSIADPARLDGVQFMLFTNQLPADLDELTRLAVLAGASRVLFKPRLGAELPKIIIDTLGRGRQ